MNETTGLILFSHGSLLCGAGETLLNHAEKLREKGEFACVEVGYLNYSEPPFDAAVQKCVRIGARRIVVLPYFLVPGKFVTYDLPRAVATAGVNHPKIEFRIAPPIGYDASIARALIDLAQNASPASAWRRQVDNARNYCKLDPRCPLYDPELCKSSRLAESGN